MWCGVVQPMLLLFIVTLEPPRTGESHARPSSEKGASGLATTPWHTAQHQKTPAATKSGPSDEVPAVPCREPAARPTVTKWAPANLQEEPADTAPGAQDPGPFATDGNEVRAHAVFR